MKEMTEEFNQAQQFYAERIEKIKYDSSITFNETTIKQAIDDFVK